MEMGCGVHRSLVNKNTLLYYRTEQDANNHPRGQIELSAAITVEVRARPLCSPRAHPLARTISLSARGVGSTPP